MKKPFFISMLFLTAFLFFSCNNSDNGFLHEPVSRIILIRNQDIQNPLSDSGGTPVLRGSFEMLEGRDAVLGVRLFPEGVSAGIHWQSSSRRIISLNNFSGPELTVTGTNGGRTVLSVLARNVRNEVYIKTECVITVIPSSFFKWNYNEDGWLNIEAYENFTFNTITPMLGRSGSTPVIQDTVKKGIILEGPAILNIGSVLSTPTNSPFPDDPLFDIGGMMDFLDGPSITFETKLTYPLWNNRVRISVEYETENPASSPLRIQVNNNTLERNNASAISNWLAAELAHNAPSNGILSGIFNANESGAAKTGVNVNNVLSNSFVSLVLPEGRILIRSIIIESFD